MSILFFSNDLISTSATS